MDINLLRSIVTVLMLLIFAGIVVWAWGRKRQAAFDAAAQLPLIDDAPSPSARPPGGTDVNATGGGA
jgi:cytochrome c oxidase cbb3-type subunit IV